MDWKRNITELINRVTELKCMNQKNQVRIYIQSRLLYVTPIHGAS